MPLRELKIADDVQVGDAIVYVDRLGKEHFALVTAVWLGEYGNENPPGVNLVYASDNPDKGDTYGRQIERESSVVYQSGQPAHGNYWHHRLPGV